MGREISGNPIFANTLDAIREKSRRQEGGGWSRLVEIDVAPKTGHLVERTRSASWAEIFFFFFFFRCTAREFSASKTSRCNFPANNSARVVA